MFITMIKDLEDTRDVYNGYSYVRTMRNILIGKSNAAIAPYFKDKPYYGIFPDLKLEDLENIMDSFVKANLIDVIYTNNGKLYCTHEYHNELCRKESGDKWTYQSTEAIKDKPITYDANKIIKLTDESILEVDRDSIICYVLIGGNPYGVEGNVYIFTCVDNVINIYKGNIYGQLSRESVCGCIPEMANCYSSTSGMGKGHPKGWTVVYYLMGHYVYVPRNMAMKVQDNWKVLASNDYKAEERMVRGICDAYISLLLDAE